MKEIEKENLRLKNELGWLIDQHYKFTCAIRSVIEVLTHEDTYEKTKTIFKDPNMAYKLKYFLKRMDIKKINNI